MIVIVEVLTVFYMQFHPVYDYENESWRKISLGRYVVILHFTNYRVSKSRVFPEIFLTCIMLSD
jgi:hypothetical protein